jgi:hypothetical protein
MSNATFVRAQSEMINLLVSLAPTFDPFFVRRARKEKSSSIVFRKESPQRARGESGSRARKLEEKRKAD